MTEQEPVPVEFKPCERCGKRQRCKGERFCVPCKKVVMREMKQAGYLQVTRQIGRLKNRGKQPARPRAAFP